jgi:predicted exporter
MKFAVREDYTIGYFKELMNNQSIIQAKRSEALRESVKLTIHTTLYAFIGCLMTSFHTNDRMAVIEISADNMVNMQLDN